MSRPGLISGTVENDAGTPVSGARVYFVAGPGAFPDTAALTGDDGGFLLSAPDPGTYQVEVTADGFAPETTSVAAVAGGRAAVRVVLRRT